MSEDGHPARVANGLHGNRLAPQERLQLSLQTLLAAFFADESEHVPGERALRIEALRFLDQLDSVQAEGGDARGSVLVHAPPQPDEPLLAGQLRQDVLPIHAQRGGEPVRGRAALARTVERARVREDRVDVLGHGERGPAPIGDQPSTRRPFDLAPGLVASQPREARAIEQLHLRRAGDHQRESGEQAERDERDAEPHPAARVSVRAAPRMPHEPSYLEATIEALERSAPPTSTMIRSGGGGPMPRRARARSSMRCALPSRAAAS